MAASNNTFLQVELNENDVPGAKLPYIEIENHSIVQLKRWLQCRDLKTTGNKDDLIKRVKTCIASGNDKISVSIDSGKWFEIKQKTLQKTIDLPQPSLPPVTGWNIFPSVNLPKHFNHGHIHHHIVESVQFIGAQNSTDDSNDDIEDLHTSKPMSKGKDFFKSGHVQALKDCEKDGKYFLKAKVMASYCVNTFYDTMIQISKESGFVKDASCTCVASAMGRCNHVCALLFALEDYILQYGVDILSCTSKKCEWNKGRAKQKNPKRVADAKYESVKKRKVDSIVEFDCTPGYVQRTPLQAVTDLLNTIEGDNQETPNMWQSILCRQYQDYDINSEMTEEIKEKRRVLLENISLPTSSHPQELVTDQGCSQWYSERRVRVTASESKTISCAQNVRSVHSILKRKLWGLEGQNLRTKAMIYGNENESNAFSVYKDTFSSSGIKVAKTGLWCHPKMPEIACSPDGLITDPSEDCKYGLLEIKCPFILEGKSVQNFADELTKKQLNTFCLQKCNNQVILKRNHAYYYQVQTQLGVMGLQWCDFVIWSSVDMLVIRIRFDSDFWSELSQKLLEFHHQWLCPELIEMRIPRRLLPVKVD